jgi:hypothetical protein
MPLPQPQSLILTLPSAAAAAAAAAAAGLDKRLIDLTRPRMPFFGSCLKAIRDMLCQRHLSTTPSTAAATQLVETLLSALHPPPSLTLQTPKDHLTSNYTTAWQQQLPCESVALARSVTQCSNKKKLAKISPSTTFDGVWRQNKSAVASAVVGPEVP